LSSRIDRREFRIKYILGLLEDNPDGLRHKEIKVRWMTSGFPEGNFYTIFHWLVERGYIKKRDGKHLSPYVLTEAGKKHLNGLRA